MGNLYLPNCTFFSPKPDFVQNLILYTFLNPKPDFVENDARSNEQPHGQGMPRMNLRHKSERYLDSTDLGQGAPSLRKLVGEKVVTQATVGGSPFEPFISVARGHSRE